MRYLFAVVLCGLFLLSNPVSADGPAPRFSDILYLLVFNLLLELFAAVVFFMVSRLPLRLMPSVFYANLLSYPLFLLAAEVLALLAGGFESFFWLVVLFLEVLVVVFEARIILKLCAGSLTYKQALSLSFLTNAVSFLVFVVVFWM